MANPTMIMTFSVGMGAAIFIGFILFRFVRRCLKSRAVCETSGAALAAASPSRSWEEKRGQPRLPVAWQAEISTKRGHSPARIRDISAGGAFVVCSRPLPLGEPLHLTIHPPRQRPLEVKAEVVWSNAHVPRQRVIHRGMGVRFIVNEPEQRQLLQEAIAEGSKPADD